MEERNVLQERLRSLPAIRLRKAVVLPGQYAQLEVVRDEAVQALDHARTGGGIILAVGYRDEELFAEEVSGVSDDTLLRSVCAHGTICQIVSVDKSGSAVHVRLEGLQKARVVSLTKSGTCLRASVEPVEPVTEDGPDARRMRHALKEQFNLFASSPVSRVSRENITAVRKARSLDEAMQAAAASLTCDYSIAQRILDAEERSTAYELICIQLEIGIENAELLEQLRNKVRDKVDKNQRDYLLREQLKVIQEELGEELPQSEAEEYLQQLEQLQCSEEIREKIRKQILRFRTLSGSSQEATVARNYIETLLAMPWDKTSEDRNDLAAAAKVLDEDHYGLEKVKERIIEYLAVRSLTSQGNSPILCLAGPPGTGKTSIARSIARALDRRYVRIGLGGVHDESEIRGHRRTYIGAMPGRIADALKQAGVKNPLILLDEVDKLNASYNGDPSAALLEALDAEQNSQFTDHYIDMPTDLSQVMFIATANDLHTVPAPLLDRLEIIDVGSYTDNEKFHIAKEHLLPKQRMQHGLAKKQLTVTDKALQEIIAGWTAEAGVRSLERQLGRICRKSARIILEDGKGQVRVKAGNLEEFLGRRQIRVQTKNRKDEIGLVRGLAWTRVGGVTLEVEVNVLPGKGQLKLTGQLGDVMKESASAAMTYVRSAAGSYGIAPEYFAEQDFHVHIPEGAVPKDGPSAGITLATAVLSAAAGIPVRADTAMTGEVTLRGRVLAIGGLKEKLLAAQKAGMKQVIVPEANRAQVEEISEEIIGSMHIIYASTMQEVLAAAFAGPAERGKA